MRLVHRVLKRSVPDRLSSTSRSDRGYRTHASYRAVKAIGDGRYSYSPIAWASAASLSRALRRVTFMPSL